MYWIMRDVIGKDNIYFQNKLLFTQPCRYLYNSDLSSSCVYKNRCFWFVVVVVIVGWFVFLAQAGRYRERIVNIDLEMRRVDWVSRHLGVARQQPQAHPPALLPWTTKPLRDICAHKGTVL